MVIPPGFPDFAPDAPASLPIDLVRPDPRPSLASLTGAQPAPLFPIVGLTGAQEEITALQMIIQNFVDFVSTAFDGVFENAELTFDSFGEFLDEATAAWELAWEHHGETITSFVSGLFAGLTVAFTGAFILISGVVLAGLSLLIGDFAGAWAIIQNTLNSFLKLILSLVGVTLDEFTATWEKNFELLVIILNETAAAITEKLNDIFESIANFLKRAGQAIRDTRGAFRQAGVDLIRGLGDGIKSAVDSLLDTLKSALQDVINLVNRIFATQSPSKVFEKIGMNVMAGMEQGLVSGMPGVENILGGLTPDGITNAGGRNTSVTFNITGSDPEEIARQVSRTLRLQGVRI